MEGVKKQLKNLGSRFAFEFALEMFHDDIIKALRASMEGMQPADIPAMVVEMRFPMLDHVDFSMATDNIEHLEGLSAIRMMELVAEARPDLAEAVQAMDMAGAEYVVRLRQHLLDRVKHPELAMSKSTEYSAPSNMARASCDQCGKSWTVPKSEAPQACVCPFCGSH